MDQNNVGIAEIFRIYKEYCKHIIIVTCTVFLLSVIYSLLATPLYKSYVSIYPTGNESNFPSSFAGLDGIASTLGFNLSGGETNTFNFPDIVNSRRLKKDIISKEWDTDIYTYPVNLIKYWGIDEPGFLSMILFSDPSPNEHLQNIAIDHLTTLMTVYEHESGMITISVLMEDPKLAADIVKRGEDFSFVDIKAASMYCGMDVYLTRKLALIYRERLTDTSKKLTDLLIKDLPIGDLK